MVAETVVPFRPRMGRPSLAEERDLDHRFHASEESEQAAIAQPLIDRLYLVARDYGPVAMQTVAALDYWHRRHERRWADTEGDVA